MPISDTRPTDEPEIYAFTEKNEAGEITALIIGGTKFNAGNASEANPAQALTITYQTNILDTLLLPSPDSDNSNANDPLLLSEDIDNSVAILNTVKLFTREGTFLGIHDSATVNADRPTWIEKKGETVRDYGNGSTTTWTVKFFPNGYTFGTDNSLTLHDQLPEGSTLDTSTVAVQVGETTVEPSSVAVTATASGFTISPIETANQEVTITYQTKVSEDMYDNSADLGSNIAWFTFSYGGQGYTTSKAKTAVGSGYGSNSSSTAILNKTNSGYDSATRSMKWTVTLNPHKSNFTSGTFIDNLNASAVGGACNKEGHNGGGLELFGGVSGVSIDIVDSTGQSVANNNLVTIDYTDRIITATVGNIGRSTVTLTYTTKVVDPCLFVNETRYAGFTNWIAGEDLVINNHARSDLSTYSNVTFNVDVLKKNAPVYDYATGTMTWTVEMNHAGLPLTDITLTDVLPAGLTYIENSLGCTPDTSADVTTTENTDGRQILTLNLGTVNQKTTLTFQTQVDPEAMGFLDKDSVKVENTIHMTGLADGVDFETSNTVTQDITNHGLVKSNIVDASQELIEYEVLINPFGLELPANPTLVDVMDSKLQLDWDTLRLYKVKLSGTAGDGTEKPGYAKVTDSMQTLQVKSYDPSTNSFTVELPISTGDKEAYVLTYTADITNYESGGSYTNSISFSGNTSLLGGSESNNASVSGCGGGGGGGIAARKATITITKKDKDDQHPLEGVTLTLYQWNNENGRGLVFAQADTDENGKISFRVKPGATYELVESKSLPNYESTFGWTTLPAGVTETNGSFLITAGQKGSTLELELTNQVQKTDLTFSLVNQSGIPLAGKQVCLYLENPSTDPDAEPYQKVSVLPDGTVEFSGIRSGVYYIVIPGGDSLKVTVPNDLDNTDNVPTIEGFDGTPIPLKGYQAVGTTSSDEHWTLTIKKVASDGTTPLAGATFGLYADAACQTLIKEDTSNADGMITFSGLMSDQSYYLKETTAPSGYQLNTTVYTVDKTSSTLTIQNTPVSQDEDNNDPDDSGNSEGDNDDNKLPGDSGGSAGDNDNNELPGDSGNSDEDNDNSDDSGNSDGDNDDLGDSGNSEGDNNDLNDSSNSDGDNSDLDDSSDSDEDTNSDNSGVFSGSNNSSGSGTSDQSGNSSHSGVAGTHGNNSSDPDIPQTGDSTWWFGMLTLLSGLLLAVLTAYHLWTRRQNAQK